MEKICPFLTKPDINDGTSERRILNYIDCLKEKCQLWVNKEINEKYESGNGLKNFVIGQCGLIK
jgi:hypothetical protein